MRRRKLDSEHKVGIEWMLKEEGDNKKEWQAFVSNMNYSDFLKPSGAEWELPGLFLSRVSEKHSSTPFPLQCVESPSQG